MATTAQKKAFIEKIASLAQKAYRQFGKPLPSICIAMAAVECKWGLAGSCKYNSYLGQKVGTGKTATKYWSGNYFNARTQEVVNQSTGQLKTIRDNFRAYDSVEQCIFNYYELLNTSLYKKVMEDCSYRDQMQQIKACGYMTSITEVNTCISIISQNDLTKYDETASSPAHSSSSGVTLISNCGSDENGKHTATNLTDGAKSAGESSTDPGMVAPSYTAGKVYTTQTELKVRTGPGTSYSAKSHGQLTSDGQKHDVDKDGAIDAGTKVTCKQVAYDGTDIWINTPSGWLAAYYKGKTYIK